MSVRDMVINGLEHCKRMDGAKCPECPYFHTECTASLSADALALLKEHEEHEKLLTKLGYHWTGSGETLAMCRMKDGEQDGV